LLFFKAHGDKTAGLLPAAGLVKATVEFNRFSLPFFENVSSTVFILTTGFQRHPVWI
jgi:hypothetical protein